MSIVPRASFSDDSRIIKKPLPRSLLLRDYLLDDMSSCSSNGFRSYPRRRQCFLEMDLNKHTKLSQKQQFLENKNKLKSKHEQSSMLQRASAVMIKAFKHFPFSGLWKKTNRPNKDVKLMKSFGDLIKETPGFSTVVTTMADLNNSASNSDSCSGSEFTATTNSFTTGNSLAVNLAQNDVADELPENKRVGTTTSTAAANNYSDNTENAKKWQTEQDEQFSPVSVMDFPCDNVKDNDHEDDDDVSSMFQDRHLDVEGTKKVMHKTRRFESVSQLEPVKLEDRIAQSVLESSMETCYQFSQEENQAEKKTMALLQLMKSAVLCHHFLKYEALEHLLLGFFKEKMIEETISDYEMLQTAKDWVDGQVQVVFLDWESQKNRQTYVQEMEKAVKWSKYSDEVEKENVVLELEYELFNSLVDDILLEFHL